MKEGDKIEIDGVVYQYCAFYDRLEQPNFQDGTYEKPAIACPKCKGVVFRISYGEWCCIANCKCGHSMTVYDG
jgi:hypothetical protein